MHAIQNQSGACQKEKVRDEYLDSISMRDEFRRPSYETPNKENIGIKIMTSLSADKDTGLSLLYLTRTISKNTNQHTRKCKKQEKELCKYKFML